MSLFYFCWHFAILICFKASLSSEQNETALDTTPTFLEICGHSYFFGGFLVGPQVNLNGNFDFNSVNPVPSVYRAKDLDVKFLRLNVRHFAKIYFFLFIHFTGNMTFMWRQYCKCQRWKCWQSISGISAFMLIIDLTHTRAHTHAHTVSVCLSLSPTLLFLPYWC